MTMEVEVNNFKIASYIGVNFDEFADIIYILTDWYRPYNMVGELEGIDSYQYIAREFGKYLAENEDEYKSINNTQIAFFEEVIKSYRNNLKGKLDEK